MKKISLLLLAIILFAVAPFGIFDGYAQQNISPFEVTQVHGQDEPPLPPLSSSSLYDNIKEIFPNASETIYQSSSVPLIFQYLSTGGDGLAVAIKASLYDASENTNSPVVEIQNAKYFYENTNFNILPHDIVTITSPSLLPGTYTVQYTIQHQDGTLSVIKGYHNFTIPSGPSSLIETSTYTLSPQVIQTFSALLNQSPFGNIVQIFWNFGDNTTGTGALVQHQYTGTGSYLVQVNLTDNKNYNASGTVPVQVEDTNTNINAPFTPAILSNANATIDPDTQFPMITFSPDLQTQNEISKGYLHIYWYRHHATTLENLPSAPYTLIAQNNTPFYTDGLNTTAHEYLQYQIRIQDENGYIIGSAETNALLYDTTPYVPRFTKSYFQNGIATLRYVDQDNDQGHINYKLLKAPEGYTIVNGNLQENLNTNSSTITKVIDCENPDPALVVQTGRTKLLQNHEIAGIYLHTPVKADYFLCAQSEDRGGKGSPWPVVSLVHHYSYGLPYGGGTSSGDNSDWGNPIIIALAPSITSSGGGVSNIAPDPPVLQDPKDGISASTISTLQAKYTDFNADNGFVFFRISKDIDCTNALIEGKGTSVKSGEISSWTLPQQLSPGSYYWCAKATDTYNADSIWSESWKFSVNQADPMVNNTNINGNQNTNTALLPPITPVKTPEGTGMVIGEFSPIPHNTINNTTGRTSQQHIPTSSTTFSSKPKKQSSPGKGTTVPPVSSSQTKADNDNDNATNFNETFIYGTSANDASSLPHPFSHDVHISNLQDKDILATQYPFIVGTATAGKRVSIIVVDRFKKQTTLGETYADSEGKFALTSSLPLENGAYMLYAKVYDQKNTLIASSEGVLRITVDTSVGFGAPTITSFDHRDVSGEHEITTTSPKPMVQGSYQGIEDAQKNTIIAVWQSIVTSSQATIDPLHKTFTATPEEPLAFGKHMVTLYVQQEKNGQRIISNIAHLSFEIRENTSPATTAQENTIPRATQTGVSSTNPSPTTDPPSSHPLAASLLTSQASHDSSDWVTTFFGILSLLAAGYLFWSYMPQKKGYRIRINTHL